MKKVLFLLITCLLLTGCGMKYPDLPENPIAFEAGNYTYNDDEGYMTIEYNGRTYRPYGTQKGIMQTSDIDKCIGYIIQDENISSVVDLTNKDTRIYTLTDDKDNNYLLEYYVASELMNNPTFWRATDTRGKKIHTPKIIDSLGYDYWK